MEHCSSINADEQYDIDDIILCEYGTTVVGLEMMRSVNEENAEETRKVQIVKSAISTLVVLRAGSHHRIFSTSWTEMKGSWLPARSQTVWASPVPLS